MAQILISLFGDKPGGTMVARSPGHPTFDHLWFRFSQGIDEVINERVWEGIHFRNSDEQGMHAGRCVGQFVVRHALRSQTRATGNQKNNDRDDDHLDRDSLGHGEGIE